MTETLVQITLRNTAGPVAAALPDRFLRMFQDRPRAQPAAAVNPTTLLGCPAYGVLPQMESVRLCVCECSSAAG